MFSSSVRIWMSISWLSIGAVLVGCQRDNSAVSPLSESNTNLSSTLEVHLYLKNSNEGVGCIKRDGSSTYLEPAMGYAAVRESVESQSDIEIVGLYQNKNALLQNSLDFPCKVARSPELGIIQKSELDYRSLDENTSGTQLTALKWTYIGFEHKGTEEEISKKIGLPELLKETILSDFIDNLNENPESEKSVLQAVERLKTVAQSDELCLLPPGTRFTIYTSAEVKYSNQFSYVFLVKPKAVDQPTVTLPEGLPLEAQLALQCNIKAGFIAKSYFARTIP